MKEGDVVAGRYRLLRPIGAGAMGSVWAARHEMLGRDFAIKFATIPTRAGPEARARFLMEAQIVGRLRHPNIVDVADVGEVEESGGLYLAMELLEGESLASRIQRLGNLRVHEALSVLIEVSSGLAAAHEAGVVHRDIKPENIFLAKGTNRGVIPKLLDFGVSKSNMTSGDFTTLGGQLFGTPAYMSPEQALGETDIDHRTDIWSLGVVMYETLTGRHPFVAPSYQALLPKIAEEAFEPLPDTVPEIVRVIVTHCLAKRREDRYPTADTLREALEDAFLNVGAAEPGSLVIERVRVIPSLVPARPNGVRATQGSFGSLSPSIAPYMGVPRRRLIGWAALASIGVAGAAVLGLALLRPRPPAPASSTSTAVVVAPSAPASAAGAPSSAPSSAPTSAPKSAPKSAPTSVDAAPASPNDTADVNPSAARPPSAKGPGGNRRKTVTKVNSAGF